MPLVHGEPITYAGGQLCVVRGADGRLAVKATSDVDPASIVVHDAHAADATFAFELSQLTDTQNLSASPIGIFRNVSRPVFDDEARRQVSMPADREAALQRLVSGPDTWTVI